MKVCFITCHYPPLSRTYRRYKFARLLADGGCPVEVVTHGNVSRALGSFVEDPDMGGEDPDLPVHRPRALPWHLLGEGLYRVGLLPCPHLNWLLPAARCAGRIAASPADVVLGVYPPLTDLLAARRVSRQTGARLVVDFRDEFLGLAGPLQRPWARRCERLVVEQAALVSVATEAVAESLARRYGLPAGQMHLTDNGYWEEVSGDLSLPEGPVLRLVYAGALSPVQGLETLCRAVERLRRTAPALAGNLEVVVYGPDNFYLRQKLLPLMGEGVRYGGFLSAGQVSAALLGAGACFLSLASEAFSYAVPGKLYEYIAHARPVLAALPQGSARRLIETEGFGLVAACGDEEQLAGRMAQMLDGERRRHFHRQLLEKRHAYAAAPHFLSLARRIQELA